MSKTFKAFQDFAIRGNVVDMAVGIMIGAAFNSVVNSLVEDIIMPPIGLLLGDTDFSGLYFNLSGGDYASLAAAQEAGAATINYGLFLNNVLNLLIIALVLFLVVRQVNRWRREPETAPAPTVKDCPYCFRVIPIKATRCPECTAHLEAKTAEKPAAGGGA